MQIENKGELFITCDCEDDALSFEVWRFNGEFPSCPLLCISLWKRGYDWSGKGLLFKIKTFFQMLRHKHPYTDTVIFDDKEKVRIVRDYLDSVYKEMEEYENDRKN